MCILIMELKVSYVGLHWLFLLQVLTRCILLSFREVALALYFQHPLTFVGDNDGIHVNMCHK